MCGMILNTLRCISDGGWWGWGRRRMRTEAFRGGMSRCRDRGHNPVCFHFKHGGRETWPVKLMCWVHHVLAHATGPSIFQLAHCVCVCVCFKERVGRTSPLLAEFYSKQSQQVELSVKHMSGAADLSPPGYLSSPWYLWCTINASGTHLHVWPTSHLRRLHMWQLCVCSLWSSAYSVKVPSSDPSVSWSQSALENQVSLPAVLFSCRSRPLLLAGRDGRD